MASKTQGSCEAILKPPDPENPTAMSGACTSDTLLNQVITERNALRVQNEQLWKIIEKQRTIIQQLQRVCSKRSDLLRQRSAEQHPLDTLSKDTLEQNEVTHLKLELGLVSEPYKELPLAPLSPNSLESHTDELLFQIEFSSKTSQLAYTDGMASDSDKRRSYNVHTRAISLDTDYASNKISYTIIPKAQLRRSLTSPISLNMVKSPEKNVSLEKEVPISNSNFSRPPRTNCPPSPLSLENDDSADVPTGNKIKVPLSPLFPPPILKSSTTEEAIHENSDGDLDCRTNIESPSIQEETTHEAPDTVTTIRPQRPYPSNGSLRLTLDDFGLDRATISQEHDKKYKEFETLRSKTGSLLIEHGNVVELTNEDSKHIEQANHVTPKLTNSSAPTQQKQGNSVRIESQSKLDNSHLLNDPQLQPSGVSQSIVIDKTTAVDSVETIRRDTEPNNSTPNSLTLPSSKELKKSPRVVVPPVSVGKYLPSPNLRSESPSTGLRSITPVSSPVKPAIINQGCKLTSLIGVDIRVTGSAVRINANGKEILVFLIGVGRRNGFTKFHELWSVEKYYSDFLALDAQLKRTQPRNIVLRIGKLPDRSLFFTYAPSKVDQRKLALQKYLQHLISLSFSQNADVCEFLSTNVSKQLNKDEKIMGIKEGYLTKRGKNFGGWKRRYFVLKSPTLQYYEAKDGSYLGSISIPSCQISRQPSGIGESDTPYRHAFMIVEPKKNGSGMNRHILCADSDTERDEWVMALNFYTRIVDSNKAPLPHASTTSEAESDGSKSAKKGGKLRKLIRNDSPKSNNNSPTQQVKSPIPPLSPTRPTNHACVETNIRGHVISASVGCNEMESSGVFEKSMHRKSSSFKERLLRPLSPPPPVPLLTHTEDITLDSLPLSPSTPKKSFGSNLIGSKQNKEKESNTPRKKTPFSWGKKIFASGDPKNRAVLVPVFGLSLEKAVEISKVKDGYELPAIVHRCIEYLDAKEAHKEEGIYRLSGSTSTVRALRDKFNTGSPFLYI